ncbi:hypothetical protein C7422_108160 [Pantoea ananatis]|nr:hypothetical protein C7422_108160 [Pantoea ananatis]
MRSMSNISNKKTYSNFTKTSVYVNNLNACYQAYRS